MSLDTKRKHYLILTMLLAMTGIIISISYHVLERKWVMFRKAENFYSSGRFESAISYYKSALNLGLDRADVYLNLGNSYLATDRPELAKEAFGRLIECDPESVPVLLGLAGILAARRQYQEAIGIAECILAKNPSDRTARIYLARFMGWSGDMEGAIEQYRKVVP
mgnify:CR=1 FL=1